jgi:hypothetical protein
VELERLEAHEARESLGVFSAMDANQIVQAKALKEKAIKWADKVRTQRLSQAEAWFSLQYCVMKSLEYPLMATSLSKAQCETIMRPIRAAALPAIGINRHLTLTIAHGPQCYQGVGIPDLWTVQGILKLWVALKHGDAPTITGNQLRASMELHTIEIGLPGHLTQQEFSVYGHLSTKSWLTHLWEFCDDSDIQITSTTPMLKLARTDDTFLMSTFAAFGYRKKQLKQLNVCRLFCHATRISDITTGDGKRIHAESWKGQVTDSAGTEYEWPVQGRPTKQAWDLWRAAIRSCYLTLHHEQQQLRQPLGNWIGDTPRNWQWFFSPTQDRVYQYIQKTREYNIFSIVLNRRRLRSPKYTLSSQCIQLPEDAERATTTKTGNSVVCHGSYKSKHTSKTRTTLEDHIQDNDKWAVQSIQYDENGKNVAQAIILGTAIAVCDGSYKDDFGTAAFVLQRGASKQETITGAHVTPGHPEDINPYRSELGGILAIVVIAEAIASFHDIQTGTIELGCDCESGIISIFQHAYDTPKQPQHDLIHEIRQKIATSRITWKYRHVSGHQDKHISYHMLNIWEQLNVDMDNLAKIYWTETNSLALPFYPQATYGWNLWTGPRKLSTWDRKKLYEHAKSTEILEHWSRRRSIPHDKIRSIDWEAGKEAIKKLGLNRSIWIPKWLGGFAAVGKVQQRNNFQDHAECPRCSEFETTEHVTLCQAPNAQREWDASMAALQVWLTKALTMPDIQKAILSRLQTIRRHDEDMTAPSYSWPGVNDLILEQDTVGWRNFLEGGILKKWAAKQQEYYTWLKRRNTGKRWVATLIKKLWEISWNMWEQRNGELKNPASPASLREHARLDASITHEYTDTTTLAKRDRRWFRRPKEILFTEALEFKQQWLESVGIARARFARRRNTSTQAQRNLMRATFRRTPLQATTPTQNLSPTHPPQNE